MFPQGVEEEEEAEHFSDEEAPAAAASEPKPPAADEGATKAEVVEEEEQKEQQEQQGGEEGEEEEDVADKEGGGGQSKEETKAEVKGNLAGERQSGDGQVRRPLLVFQPQLHISLLFSERRMWINPPLKMSSCLFVNTGPNKHSARHNNFITDNMLDVQLHQFHCLLPNSVF